MRAAIREARSCDDILSRIKFDLGVKSRKTANSRFFDRHRIFSPDGRLLKLNLSEADRVKLVRRIRTFVYSRRRGKLRLPRHFPQEVLRLSELTKRQLRDMLYWVKPNQAIECRMDHATFDRIARDFPGILWNAPKKVLGHIGNLVGVNRLGLQDWPRRSRGAWPSTPSITELTEMSRLGLVSPGLDNNRITVHNCITSRQMSDDIRLATRVVKANIVGIRSTVKVQEEFLPNFRYRRGFLILTNRYCIPAGLVRYLLSQWKRNPFNLWLKENCRLKIFLSRHTPSEMLREVAGRTVRAISLGTVQLGHGKPRHLSMMPSIFDQWIADDEFREISDVRRTPYCLIDI